MIGRGELLLAGSRRNPRCRRRWLGGRAVVLELPQPLVYDVHVVLHVEVEQTVGQDGGSGAAPGGGRGGT